MNAMLKKSLPHIFAVVIFVILSTIYFYPQLKGYIIKQGDIEQFLGMSKEIVDHRAKFEEEPLWTNGTFAGMPAYQISAKKVNIPNQIKNFVLKLVPRPIGYMFFLMLGLYILLLCFNVNAWVAIIGSLAFGLASLNLLYLGAGHNAKIHALSFIPPVVGAVFFSYRKNLWFGAILLSIFLCLQLAANHLQMTYYLLYILLAIAVVEFLRYRKEKIIGQFIKISGILIIAGIIGVLPSFSNLMVTKEYAKYTTRGKSDLVTTQLSSEDNSGKKALDRDYIKQYSLGRGEIWSLVIPNAKGGQTGAIGAKKDIIESVNQQYRQTIAQQNAYWGEQLGSGGAFYFGASIFLLFLLGAFLIKDKIKWAFIAVSILAILMSWKYGKLIDFFIDNVPLFNNFRDTKMMLVVVQLSFPLLGGLFIQQLIDNQVDKKKFLYIILGANALFFIFYFVPNLFFDFLNRTEVEAFETQLANYKTNPGYYNSLMGIREALINARIEIFKKDCLRSWVFIILTSGMVYFYLIKKLKTNTFLILLGIIVLVDIWAVSKRYLNNEKEGSKYVHWVDAYDYHNPFKASVADMSIMEAEFIQNSELETSIKAEVAQMKNTQKLKPRQFQHEKIKKIFTELNFATDYRVLTLQNPFNSARESYFHKSLGGYHGAKLRRYQELIEYHISREINNLVAIIRKKSTAAQIDSVLANQPVLNMLNTKYLIYSKEAPAIINKYAQGNAWYIKKIRKLDNADEVIQNLNKMNLAETALMDKKFSSLVSSTTYNVDSSAQIKLVDYKPNYLTYSSSNKEEGVAVFSEIYYPKGWLAYIDGKEVPYFRVDYVLRALHIPAGDHKIEFIFKPESYYLGNNISTASSILLLLLIAGFIAFQYIKKSGEKGAERV